MPFNHVSCSPAFSLTTLSNNKFYVAVLSQILAEYPCSGQLLQIHSIIPLSNLINSSHPDVLLMLISIVFVRNLEKKKKRKTG